VEWGVDKVQTDAIGDKKKNGGIRDGNRHMGEHI